MKFEFYEEPAHVQKKKKYANFTIREIGGPEELAKWKEVQAAKEAVQRLRISARDERLKAFEAETGQKLDTPTVQTGSWDEKLAFAKAERARLKKIEDLVNQPAWEPLPKPKLSLWGRVKQFFKDRWTGANF